MTCSDRIRRRPFAPAPPIAWIGLLVACLLGLGAGGCSPTPTTATTASPSTASATTSAAADPDAITAENVFEQERDWPNIVAMERDWTPEGSDARLKAGHRGALMRVQADGTVRIGFGRHGNHDVPIDATDLVARANEIRTGALHKVGPAFIAHFGAQFLDPTGDAVGPYSTPKLLESTRVLCIFADPRAADFPALVAELAAAGPIPGLQMVFFPIGLAAGEIGVVREALVAASWRVPFAYPAAAEVHARSLLGEVPTTPYALLITAEGRLIERGPLAGRSLVARLGEVD